MGTERLEDYEVDPAELRKQWSNDAGAEPGEKVQGLLPLVQEYPTLAGEAFHGLAGEIAKTIDPHTESDPALCSSAAISFLGMR